MTTQPLPTASLPPLTDDAASAWVSVLLDLHAKRETARVEPHREPTDEPELVGAATGA